MSNLSGNYRISAAEVQGVDVAREQERRARLQLLDEIREPSPQPIFGEPVKVELEDETSRRIKNTLGDFTQVLVNDSKNLLGIARSSSSGHSAPSGRSHPPIKRPPTVNGMYKPSPTNIPKHPASEKRPIYPRNKPSEPPIAFHPSSTSSLHNSDTRQKEASQWHNSHQSRKPGIPPSLNGSSQSTPFNPNYSRNNPSYNCSSSTSTSSNKSYPSLVTVSSNISQSLNPGLPCPKYGESSTSSAPPPKRNNIFRPTLKLPSRKPEQPAESPIELETILREMKQAVPPPLTAIQTPRTEENGFAFPVPEPKEDIQSPETETKPTKISEPVPQPPETPKQAENQSYQSTPSPFLKKFSAVPSASKPNNKQCVSGNKELDGRKLRKTTHMTETVASSPEIIEIVNKDGEATDFVENMLNDKCINQTLDVSLQDDLEVSDSDDEPVITEVKSGTPATFSKSPLNASNAIPNTSSTNVSVDGPQAVPSNSSSSESGDSDSNDSSSESNDSDSSASSEASDADTPSKMWGLSNFFDESRRNHSPAFVPMDTSTNSSTAAVKEDPMVVPSNPKESYSLIDVDMATSVLHEYAVKDYLHVPVADPIPNFLELDTSVNIKSEILSPITSPLQASNTSTQQPPIIRGPRTPPMPSYPAKDEHINGKIGSMLKNMQNDASLTVELTIPQSENSKHSNVLQNSCDNKEEMGKVQMTAVKKLRLSKNKNDAISPRTESLPAIQSFQDNELSASKGLCDPSFSKDENDVINSVMVSSCSVPSETSESSHDNYSIKTRQKFTKSSNNKVNCASEESLSESGQKGNNLLKPATLKFKTPTRTCRASTEIKQSSKVVKSSAKGNQIDEVKKATNKSDLKDRGSSEKSKASSKSLGNSRGLSKSSQKAKKKLPKVVSKHTIEGRKSESKKKRNKFHIENFLQSPTVSQSETDQLSKVSASLSPSPEKSPIPDKNASDIKRKPSVSPSHSSQNLNKVINKGNEKSKNCEKLRRSARCSERASSSAQAESSTALNQNSDTTKKTIKRTPKRREQSGLPIELEEPPQLLSPIPLTSPNPSVFSECAIPNKIMVCIPLSKLSRLPIPMHNLDLESKSTGKNRSQSVNDSVLKKDDMLLEKELKSVTNKRLVVKDIKDKPRTDSVSKNKTKSATFSKKDKNSKSSEHLEITKSKNNSTVNSKTSIKSSCEKPTLSTNETKNYKKRKSEGDDKLIKKKLKTYPDPNQERLQHSSLNLESSAILTELSTKPKSLERCDSVSSLSSLGSQMSQRSSKGKKTSTPASDSKKEKTSLSGKHIKQEKEDKLKTAIKKEPASPEKIKEKSRDQLNPSDLDIKPSIEQLRKTSSQQLQYYHWDDSCKDDLKGFLPIAHSVLNISRESDWDHFPEMNKEMKKASNKHNDAIMPMDYYYTEGRKQKHIAEREKDPFLQAIKFFEATVLFILTSQQREEYTKELESVYQFYRETLNFSNVILQNVHIQQSSPGSTEFKVLILLLRCQALLHVKLYSLKIKEIKEQQKNVSDFFMTHCPATVKSLSHPTPLHPRLNLISVPSSPHSPSQSPASSINSQTSGYCSSDLNGNHMKNVLSLSQNMLEMICRQHTHLINLHMGHDLWEQADMYMTRSNLREFFKEVADLSENLTLHSSIKDLVSYIQTGISLVKKSSR